MSFEDDERFKLDDSDVIWRYIDFTKFVSMLETKSLYFTRADQLLELDPSEGFFHELKFFEQFKNPEWLYKSVTDSAKKEHPLYLFVNCWHINEDESDAMWKLYAKNNGIVIKSAIGKLKNSLKENPFKIKGNVISYYDRKNDTVTASDSFERFSKKRKSFSHESEFRLFHFNPNGKNILDRGNLISISVDDLIDKIIVSPFSPNWFFELAKSIWKKYGFNEKLIEKSTLYETPP